MWGRMASCAAIECRRVCPSTIGTQLGKRSLGGPSAEGDAGVLPWFRLAGICPRNEAGKAPRRVSALQTESPRHVPAATTYPALASGGRSRRPVAVEGSLPGQLCKRFAEGLAAS